MASLDALERDLFDTSTPSSIAAIRQRIIAEATRQGVDPALALALAQRESRFDPRAVSPTDVEGLFQVTVPTGRAYGQTAQTRRDPDVSMRAGIGHLADLLRETKGDVRAALARYGDPNEPDYPEKVLAHYASQKASLSGGRAQPVARIDDLERDLFGGAAKPPPPHRRPGPAPLTATEPSDIVLPIEKGARPPVSPPSPASQQAVRQMQPLTPLDMRAARGEPAGSGWGDVAGMGVQAVTTAAGATLGGMTGPLAPLAVPGLAGLGSYYGHRLSQELGLTPGTPELLPKTLADYLSFLPAVPGFGYAALPWSRAGKATMQAREATSTAQQAAQEELAQGQAARLQRFGERERASQAAISRAETTARTQTDAQHAAWLQKMQAYRDDMQARVLQHRDLTSTAEREAREATEQAKLAYRTDKAEAYQEAVQKRNDAVTKWRQAVADEQRDLEATFTQRRVLEREAQDHLRRLNAAAQEAYATKGQAAYHAAVNKMRTEGREQAEALKAYDDAVRENTAAVERLQALPEQYRPPVPARNVADVQRDMAFLERGGTSAQAVMERLGVNTVEEASARLADEGGQLMAQGGRMVQTPQPPPATLSRRERANLLPEPEPAIMKFIANKGRIKLEGDDYARNFEGLLPGYINNKSGLPLEKMAQDAAEAGLIRSPDKGALLDAVREAQRSRVPQAPPPELAGPQPQAPMRPGPVDDTHAASRVLYQRLEQEFGPAGVDRSPAIEVAEGLKARMEHMPARLQRVMQNLLSGKSQATVSEIQQELRELGPLMVSPSGTTRGHATQLWQGYHDALEQALPQARDQLQRANVTWKQEQGVQEFQRLIQRRGSGAIINMNEQNQPVLNLKSLFNQLSDETSKLRKWFTPEQWQEIQADLSRFQGTPARPAGARPLAPDVAPLPGLVDVRAIGQRPPPQTIADLSRREQAAFMPFTRGAPTTPLPPPVRVRDVGPEPPAVAPDYPKPVTLGEPPPMPRPVEPSPPTAVRWEPPPPLREVPEVQPQLKLPRLLRLGAEGATPILLALGLGLPTGTAAKVGATLMGGDLAMYAIGRLLLSPAGRPLLHDAMRKGGVMSPELAAVLGALAAEGQSLAQSHERKR